MPSTEARPPVRVLVVDDDPLVRRTVKEILREAGFTVIGEATDGREAVELTLHYQPDIVLMDVVMPGVDGIEATKRIVSSLPDQRVVLLTADHDDDLAVTGLRCGAVGYLRKAGDIEALPQTLRGAMVGEAAISRRLALRLIERLRTTREGTLGLRPVRSTLTSREWEVLDLLCSGESTEGIAETLVLSTETVRSHVKAVLRKLGVNSRDEAIARAERLREQRATGEDSALLSA